MPSVLRRSNRNVPACPEKPEHHGDLRKQSSVLGTLGYGWPASDFPAALVGIVTCDRPAHRTQHARRSVTASVSLLLRQTSEVHDDEASCV